MKTHRQLVCCLLQSLAAVSAHGQDIRKMNPPDVARPVAPYSHVAEVPAGTRMLFLAGQVGYRSDGTLAAGVEEQAVQALENIRLIWRRKAPGRNTSSS